MESMRTIIERIELAENAGGERVRVACEVFGFNHAKQIQGEFGGVISPSFPDVVEFPSRKEAEPAIAKMKQLKDEAEAQKAKAAAGRKARRSGHRYTTGQDDAGRGGGGMGF